MNAFNKKYEKSFTLSFFKDPSQYSVLEEKIFQDLKKSISRLPNWDFLEQKFDKSLVYEINGPKGFGGKLLSGLGIKNPLKKFGNNPHLELEISLKRNSNNLDLKIIIAEGGRIMGANLNSNDFIGSYVLSLGKGVQELTTNIQEIITKIVLDSVNDFEKNRVDNNTVIKDEILNRINQIDYKDDIKSSLISNQNLFSDDHIQKILKVLEFYETNLMNYKSVYDKIKDDNFVNQYQREIDETLELLPFMYNSVLVIESYISEMINSLIKNDKVTYFSIYNVFEENGVFLSKGEKIMIENTNKLLDQLNKLNSSMNTLISLTLTISEKLSSINRNLKINNLLTGINTYQLHSINKKLK